MTLIYPFVIFQYTDIDIFMYLVLPIYHYSDMTITWFSVLIIPVIQFFSTAIFRVARFDIPNCMDVQGYCGNITILYGCLRYCLVD